MPLSAYLCLYFFSYVFPIPARYLPPICHLSPLEPHWNLTVTIL